MSEADWNERLKAALARKGWTQAELARRVVDKDGKQLVPIASIRKYYNGNVSQPRGKTLDLLANALEVDPEWLRGGTQGGGKPIPVIGIVGAGAEIFAIDDHAKGAALEMIEPPPGTDEHAVAVEIRGDSMWPAYDDGDIVVYEPPLDDLSPLLGRQCVVRTEDGRSFVKVLTAGGAPGVYTLVSFNAAPIQNVRIEWAARISWIRKKTT